MINVLIGVAALFIFVCVVVVVHHECMSDKEREKNGLGPKGQGR